MQRTAKIVLTLVTVAALLSQALAQNSPHPHKRHPFVKPTAPQSTLTPEQRAEVKASNVTFTACRRKADARNLADKERRAFVQDCLRGK